LLGLKKRGGAKFYKSFKGRESNPYVEGVTFELVEGESARGAHITAFRVFLWGWKHGD
jgi:hypothetical protein